MGNQQNNKGRAKKGSKGKRKLAVSGGGPEFGPDDMASPDIGAFVKECLELGVYVAWYTSRDGGAVCVMVMHDDFETTKLWLKSEDDLVGLMEAIQDAVGRSG